MTANAGDNIVFNCDVEFPGGHPVPYVVQWWKKGKDLPIYIWYDNYPTHTDKQYQGRVSDIQPGIYQKQSYGTGCVNLTLAQILSPTSTTAWPRSTSPT